MSYAAPNDGDESLATVTVVEAPNDDSSWERRYAEEGDASHTSMKSADSDDRDRSDVVLILIFVASIIEFWQALEYCTGYGIYKDLNKECNGRAGYAVAAGVVSAGLVGIYVLLLHKCVPKGSLGAQMFSTLLFVWWFFAASVGTFKEPFTVASNGFLAQWICLFGSFYLVYVNIPRCQNMLQTIQDKGNSFCYISVVWFASAVVLVAGSIACDAATDCSKEIAFAVACPVISLCVSTCLLVVEMERTYFASLCFFLAVWSFSGVAALTFESPFVVVGNGYCGTWAAFVASAIACVENVGDIPVIGPMAGGSQQ